MLELGLEDLFPALRGQRYQIASPADDDYNCVAWAAEDNHHRWWPNDGDVWPVGVTRVETLDAFRDAFATLGFSTCENSELEAGCEKIAIYALAGIPKHAARQLANGRWTSKLGLREDIEHDLHHLAGAVYGTVAMVMKRPARKRE